MKISVPRRDERFAHRVGEIHSHQANIAGTRNVYDVRIEALNRIAKLSGPKPEQRIKTEVLFDGNGCAAPLDLQARICAPSELTIVVIAMYNQHGLARGFG